MRTSDLAAGKVKEVGRVKVDAGKDVGALEIWRHGYGLGGINSKPLPARVSGGMAKLRPRLVRIFIQEFFGIYPEHGVFDWSRLDPFMEAMGKTGAKILAAIVIKPRVLFPAIDQKIWRPSDVAEWQRVIGAMVKRYSVDKKLVTHWCVGNEVDIGENGGTPFLVETPEDYAEFYKMTIKPILEVFPEAKVGGPAVANAAGDLLEGFVKICRRDGVPVDFVCWHLYVDDVEQHRGEIVRYRKILDSLGGKRPEMMVTEWNKGFDALSVEELAFEPRRAAHAGTILLAMMEAGLDWSFYYHFLDQVAYWEDFSKFFAKPEVMYHHWNEVPHRFGLFGVGGEVRPQYFLYWMLLRLGERRLLAESDCADLRVIAGKAKETCGVVIINFGVSGSDDRAVKVRVEGVGSGSRELVVYRIDHARRWDAERLEMEPVERREVDVHDAFECEIWCEADSVTLVELRG